MKKIVLAYSGGLDTSYCLKKFSNEGFEVHAISVNTGGFTEKELAEIEKNAYKLGASKYKSINAIEEFYNKIVTYEQQTMEEANIRAKVLQRVDKHHHVYQPKAKHKHSPDLEL